MLRTIAKPMCEGVMLCSMLAAAACGKAVDPAEYPRAFEYIIPLLEGSTLRDGSQPDKAQGDLIDVKSISDARFPQISAINSFLTIANSTDTSLRVFVSPILSASNDGVVIGNNRVVGGAPCESYPAVGALYYEYKPGQLAIHCTATVIGKQTALTAAHCVYGYDSQKLVFKAHPAPEREDAQLADVTYRITKSIHHNNYRRAVVEMNGQQYLGTVDDIAVVYLDKEFKGDIFEFPKDPIDDAKLKGAVLDFVGYGYTNVIMGEDASAPPKFVGAGRKTCVRIKPSLYRSSDFYYNSPGLNTCNGDSGGPAIIDLDGKNLVVGITSWGDRFCQEYGVDMRIDAYGAWIGARVDALVRDVASP